MREKLTKIVKVATIGLALAFTYSHSSASSAGSPPSGESYAAEYGCKWNYIFQQGWLVGGTADMVRANAVAESRSNPNCAEVIWEAVQRENGNSELSGGSYAAARGCRWAHELQNGFLLDEEIRVNVAVEALQYNNCAEVLREAKRRENR